MRRFPLMLLLLIVRGFQALELFGEFLEERHRSRTVYFCSKSSSVR
jgi:hypothetical protein